MISLLIPLALAAAEPIAPSATLSPAQRSGGAASAQIIVRIIKNSASIGADHSPPASGAMVRSTTIETADGRLHPARITIFE